ncbi:hypothetical protein [Brevibacillus parabrevis]|nr:hypothetical protein [Brevibacillus parabrevis]
MKSPDEEKTPVPAVPVSSDQQKADLPDVWKRFLQTIQTRFAEQKRPRP